MVFSPDAFYTNNKNITNGPKNEIFLLFVPFEAAYLKFGTFFSFHSQCEYVVEGMAFVRLATHWQAYRANRLLEATFEEISKCGKRL
jgi:hypothetical protein